MSKKNKLVQAAATIDLDGSEWRKRLEEWLELIYAKDPNAEATRD